MLWPLVVVGILVVVLVGAIGIYNALVTARQQANNAWAQVEVQLKRRYDLIPNLVEVAKGYMNHEKDTLERVIQARNMAIEAKSPAEHGKAEGVLGQALTGIFGIMEAYPDLKANQNMLALQEELSQTENKISFARQYYNEVTTNYNTKLEVFPSSIFASSGGFKPRELFLVEEPAQREPVKVQF